MKKITKKIFIIGALVVMMLCNSITLLAENKTYDFIIYFTNKNTGVQFRKTFTSTVKDCALVRYNSQSYKGYCYVDGEFIELKTSNYLVGNAIDEKYDNSSDTWSQNGTSDSIQINVAVNNFNYGIDMYESLEEFKNAISPEPSTEQPEEEPSTDNATYNTYIITFECDDDKMYEFEIVTPKKNVAIVCNEQEGIYYFSYYENNNVYILEPNTDNCLSITGYIWDKSDINKENVKTNTSVPYLFGIIKDSLSGSLIFDSRQDYIDYCNGVTATPPDEQPTEQPTEEPTEEPITTPTTPPSDDSDTENIDHGVAENLVNDLIGNCKEFTPQSVMAIFVVCLVLECLSHIASAILSVGGMK